MIELTYICIKIWTVLGLAIGNDVFAHSFKNTVIESISKDLKNEYCVKIVRVCNLLWDSPPDYADDEVYDTKSAATDSAKEIEEDFINAGCIPDNLNEYQREEFWKRVATLHSDINQNLLKTNTFVIKKHPEGGNSIKINMWNVFKIPMVVICNRINDLSILTTNSTVGKTETTESEITDNTWNVQTNFPSDTTSTSILEGLNNKSLKNTSTTIHDDSRTSSNIGTTPVGENRWVCGKPDELARWIDQQVECSQDFINVNKRMSDIKEKKKKEVNKDCCPSKAVMDRIEIIHDIIDIIIHTRNVKSHGRSKTSGYMWLDLDHLNARLDYLNEQLFDNLPVTTTIPLNQCCPQWHEKVKKVENKFIFQSTATETFISDKSFYNFLLESQTKIIKFWASHQHRFKKLENYVLLSNSAEYCKNVELNMKAVQNIINNSRPNDYFKHLVDFVQRSFKYFSDMNDTILSVNLLIKIEGFIFKNMTRLCSRHCATNEQFKGKEMSHLEAKLNSLVENTELIKSNIYSHESMKITLTKWESIKSKLRTFEILAKVESENSIFLSQCLEKLDKLTQLLQELVQHYQTNVKAYEGIKSAIEKMAEKLYLKYQLIEEFLKKLSISFVVNKSVIQAPFKDLKQFLRQLKNDFKFVVSPSVISSLEHSNLIFTYIKNIGNTLMNNLTTNTSYLLGLSTNLQKQYSHLEGRFNKLESNMIPETNVNTSDLLSSTYNKFKNLETRFNNMKNQNLSTEDKLITRIQTLEALLKDLNDKINKMSEDAFICEDNCDWGHLPPAETLTDRIEKIKSILDIQRPEYKTTLLEPKQKT